MSIEFDIDEMIDILTKLGYTVKKKEVTSKKLRSRIYNRYNKYVVIREEEEVGIEEVFKQELIYHIFKIK